jgi:hypothetical protein
VNDVGRMICSMWRPTAAEAINRQTPRAKGVANLAKRPQGRSERAGRPRPFLGRFGPCSFPVASRMIPYLCAFACGPSMSFPSRLRLESLVCKLRSSGHLESCSSRVLTCDGLHDLLLKCMVNLS